VVFAAAVRFGFLLVRVLLLTVGLVGILFAARVLLVLSLAGYQFRSTRAARGVRKLGFAWKQAVSAPDSSADRVCAPHRQESSAPSPNRSRMADRGASENGAGPARRTGPPPTGRVCSALFFFPRGGSAQGVRALSGALAETGWQVRLAAGSLGGPDAPTNAASFFSGIDVSAVDYSPALQLADPLAAAVPFQPSYEDRPAGPDRVFAAVDDAAYERLVAAWAEALARAGAGEADLLHLHHLTPANEAALRAFPTVPIVGQLHGTALPGALLSYSLATASPTNIGFDVLTFLATAALIGGVSLSGGKGGAIGIAAGVLSLSVLQEILAILGSPDYVSSLITGALLVIVTIVWAPDLSQWFRTTRITGSVKAERASG